MGKNKCKITWPLFNYFIKEEENDIKNEIIEYEKQIPKKKFKLIIIIITILKKIQKK